MQFPYLYQGTLFFPNGVAIQNPAILISKDDLFFKYGESKDVERELQRLIKAYSRIGLRGESNKLVFISFDTFLGIPIESVTYIIRRMMGCTATGFVSDFIKHIDKPDFLTWLESEMKRAPIDEIKKGEEKWIK